MARLTLGQKAERVVRFLLGMRLPRVASMLAAYGFTQESLEEGWTLLRGLTGNRLALQPTPPPPDPGLLDQLDGWENKWFEIAEATLRRNHPTIRDQVFLNLSRTSGPNVVVSVGTFVQRLEALESGSAEAKAARALLAKRGLTSETVQDAKSLLDKLGTIAPIELPPLDEEALAAAEAALWAWYLEWSAVARNAIHDRRLLMSLGFLRASTQRDTGDEPAEDDDAIDDIVPVPV